MARNAEKEKQDIQGESAVHDFLKKHFYTDVKNLIEVNEKNTQLKGIDTIFEYNGFEYKCDEKAALDFTNEQKGRKLNTFCLELSFLSRRDYRMDGWFVNERLENNSYLFVWVDKSDENVIHNASEIREAEIALVLKQDIYDYLYTIGWTIPLLKVKDERIRSGTDKNFGNINENGCKFAFSPYLSEKPINILLSRDTYRKMPHTISKKIYC